MVEQRSLALLTALSLGVTTLGAMGTQPVQSQVIYRSTTAEPNRDYYYPQVGQPRVGQPQVGQAAGSTTIRDGRIQDSTLVSPVIIDSTIRDSTIINPVIVSPRSQQVVPQSRPVQSSSRCMLFREIRAACQ